MFVISSGETRHTASRTGGGTVPTKVTASNPTSSTVRRVPKTANATAPPRVNRTWLMSRTHGSGRMSSTERRGVDLANPWHDLAPVVCLRRLARPHQEGRGRGHKSASQGIGEVLGLERPCHFGQCPVGTRTFRAFAWNGRDWQAGRQGLEQKNGKTGFTCTEREAMSRREQISSVAPDRAEKLYARTNGFRKPGHLRLVVRSRRSLAGEQQAQVGPLPGQQAKRGNHDVDAVPGLQAGHAEDVLHAIRETANRATGRKGLGIDAVADNRAFEVRVPRDCVSGGFTDRNDPCHTAHDIAVPRRDQATDRRMCEVAVNGPDNRTFERAQRPTG